jgi:hypothetical protein
MPYFIYRVFEHPIRRLELIDREDAFGAASARTKRLRTDSQPAGATVRMIFADNELTAEDLLNRVREPVPGVVGDE